MSKREERPLCQRCKTRMQVARIERGGEDEEVWFFRCASCGGETRLILKPLA